MPNQHSPEKEPLALQIPRELMGKLKRRARDTKSSLPELVIYFLDQAAAHVVLTPEDHAAIARATQKAEDSGKRCATAFPKD